MGRIPLLPTGNSTMDMMFRHIDEQLSELYSQHGTFVPRANIQSSSTYTVGNATLETNLLTIGNTRLSGSTLRLPDTPTSANPAAPVANINTVYPELIPKAWAYSAASGNGPTAGINLSHTEAAGVFTWTFQTPLSYAFYAVVGNVVTTTNRYVVTATALSTTGFETRVVNNDAAGLSQIAHMIVVFGMQFPS